MPRLAIPLALLLLPCAVAFGGPSKSFEKHGFEWTLPSSSWEFVPVSSADVDAGFVAKVECTSASVEVWLYTKPTEGLSLSDRVKELKASGAEGMGEVAQTRVLDSTLSGVEGKVVVQRIVAEGGVKGHFRKYAIESRGKFYQMLMRTWHGAHLSVTDEINELRNGFRLLKGAGGEDEPESLKEVEGGGDGGDGDGSPHGGAEATDEDDDWPAGGPKKEGRKVSLPEKNLEWELPGDSPFQWTGAIEDANAESGQFLVAFARVERKKQEFEKNTPDFNVCRLDLLIQPASPGFKADSWMRGGGAQKDVERWKLFDDITTGKTRTKDEVKFGNHKAAFVKFEGKFRDTPSTLMMFATVLRGQLYIFRARCLGHTDTYKHLAPYVGKAISGVRFLETKEPRRGPLLGAIPDFAGKRGEDLGREKTYTGPGYTFKKPKQMARIKVRDSMNRDLQMVCEGRSDDGECYVYFEIRTFRLNIPNTPNPEPEKFIDKRAQDWLAGAGDDADTGRSNYKKGSFGSARGLKYEFTTTFDGHPLTEEGYVVKHKSVLLWIKIQYGGPDAEKTLKPLLRLIKKGMKYKR